MSCWWSWFHILAVFHFNDNTWNIQSTSLIISKTSGISVTDLVIRVIGGGWWTLIKILLIFLIGVLRFGLLSGRCGFLWFLSSLCLKYIFIYSWNCCTTWLVFKTQQLYTDTVIVSWGNRSALKSTELLLILQTSFTQGVRKKYLFSTFTKKKFFPG